MKTLSKIILALLFVTGFPACEKNRSGSLCPDGLTPSISKVRIVAYKISEINYMVGKEMRPYNGQEVSAKDSLQITLLPQTKDLIGVYIEKTKGFSLVNSAYACEPAHYLRTDQKLVDYTITSTADYDESHPAGTNLIDLFDTYGNTAQKGKLIDFLASKPQDFLVYSSSLYFNKKPLAPATHTLTFNVELDDTTFVFNSMPLKLK